MERINCQDIQHDERKDNNWTLASLNPLSWLFQTKSDDRNSHRNTLRKRNNRPISRRAGLSHMKEKTTYNNLDVYHDIQDGRKGHRKQSPSSLQASWRATKAEVQRKRRQRRRRKQQANKKHRKINIPHNAINRKYSNLKNPEDYYVSDEITLASPKDTNHQDTYHDLVMSDYDIRWP